VSVMAAEGAAGGSAAGSGNLTQVLSTALGRQPNKGTMLAVAILLIWLAGVGFFIAFEGSKILSENLAAGEQGGASYFKSILSWIGARAADWGGGIIGQGPIANKGP